MSPYQVLFDVYNVCVFSEFGKFCRNSRLNSIESSYSLSAESWNFTLKIVLNMKFFKKDIG